MVNRSVCLLLLIVLFLPVSLLYADDLEIFGGAMGGVSPNVLILFDNSSSMVLSSIDGETRLAIAKDAVKGLINDPNNQNVRFGLMVFNSSREGGYLLQPCLSRTDNSALVRAIDSINPPSRSPYTFTPLAETLVEAALDECERFYPVFQFVLWGDKTPKEAIAAALVDTAGEA